MRAGANSVTNQQPRGWHALELADDHAVAAFVAEVWEQRPDEQRRGELLGELLTAWYQGEQFLFHDNPGNGYRLEQLPNPDGRLRVTFNMLAPQLDQYVARIALDPVEPEAIPTTGSDADLDAARLQTSLCRYYRDRLNLQRVKDNLAAQIAFDGMAFSKVTWDPLAGDEFTLGRADVKRLGLRPDVLEDDDRVRRLALGDACVTNVPLRNLTWGPVGVPWEDAEYVVEARERSFSYCRDRWGLKPEDLTPAYAGSQDRWYRGSFAAGGSVLTSDHPDLVVTYELWAPRSAQHPQGVHAVVIGGKVVNRRRNRELGNPYRHGRVPYVVCRAVEIAGQTYGLSPAWNLFDPQSMLNKLASQIMELVEQHASPRTWIAMDEPISEAELASQPGGLHRYRARKPEVDLGREVPSSVYAIFDRWIRVMQDCIGVHDVSIGRAPAGGRSGRFVLALQDADNTRMAPTLKALQRWGEDLFRLLLCVLRQFVSEPRMIAIRGADNAWERRAFSGRELAPGAETSGPEAFNVILRTSGQARSRAAQIELVTMLVQYGFFDAKNPEDRRQVMRMLELGDTTGHLDPQQADRDLQRRVHEILLTGRYVSPAYYHNHDVRLSELRRYMNSDEFTRLAPELKGLFARYESDTIKLQALHPLQVQTMVQETVSAFQAAQARKAAARQQLNRLEQMAGDQQAQIQPLLRGSPGGVLGRFLAQLPEPPPQGINAILPRARKEDRTARARRGRGGRGQGGGPAALPPAPAPSGPPGASAGVGAA